jgi:hypothetical protein
LCPGATGGARGPVVMERPDHVDSHEPFHPRLAAGLTGFPQVKEDTHRTVKSVAHGNRKRGSRQITAGHPGRTRITRVATMNRIRCGTPATLDALWMYQTGSDVP